MLKGWYPEYRFSKEVDDISVRFRPDPLADRIRKASWGKSKVQLEVLKIEETLRDVSGELKPTKE